MRPILHLTKRGKVRCSPRCLPILAVIDRDYLTCAEEDIRNIKVLMTIVDGKVVFETRDMSLRNR